MCNTPRYSESGACLGVQRCEEYILLQSERDRLAGVVQGMEEQGARNLEALRREEAENDALRQEADDWRSAKAVAESKETAVHLALNDMRAERDALLKVREAADALAEEVEDHTDDNHYLRVVLKAYKEARDDRV